MVSTRPVIFKSSSHFFSHSVIVPRAAILIGINVTFMLHNFFNTLVRSRYLFFFLRSFTFIQWPAGTAKSTIFSSSLFFFFFFFFFFCWLLLAENKWSVCMLKSHWSLYVSFSRNDDGLCIYHLFLWSNFNFLDYSQWITLPTQSCLVLYSFRAILLHSLIMWLSVSFLLPHHTSAVLLRLIDFCFDMIGSYGVVLSCY